MTEPNNDPPAERPSQFNGASHDPVAQEQSVEMTADIIALRRQRVPFDQIGKLMAAKYRHDAPDRPYTKQSMHDRYHRALKDIPAREVHAHRAELNELLDEAIDRANDVLRARHPLVSNGRIMRIGKPYITEDGEADVAEGQGEPLEDAGPILAAVTEIRKLVGEIRVLNGLTVPVKQELEVSGHVNYTLPGIDMSKLT